MLKILGEDIQNVEWWPHDGKFKEEEEINCERVGQYGTLKFTLSPFKGTFEVLSQRGPCQESRDNELGNRLVSEEFPVHQNIFQKH